MRCLKIKYGNINRHKHTKKQPYSSQMVTQASLSVRCMLLVLLLDECQSIIDLFPSQRVPKVWLPLQAAHFFYGRTAGGVSQKSRIDNPLLKSSDSNPAGKRKNSRFLPLDKHRVFIISQASPNNLKKEIINMKGEILECPLPSPTETLDIFHYVWVPFFSFFLLAKGRVFWLKLRAGCDWKTETISTSLGANQRFNPFF